jgi:HK97 family phage major capsid protein
MMADLKELREKQAQLIAQAREQFDKADKDEARAAEYEAAFDSAMAEHDKLGEQIARQERMEAAEKSMRSRLPKPPKGEDIEGRGGHEDDSEISYRNVFAKVICGTSPSDLEPEERAVLKRGATAFEQRTQTAGTTTAGGYTVPTELADMIVRSMLAWGPMYDPGICTEMVTSSGNALKIPTVNDTTVPAVAHTEGVALTDDGGSDVTFGQKSLDAFAYDTEFVRWSWELDMDSIFNMEAFLSSLLGERLGRIANTQLTTGGGSGAPNGIVTAATLGKTAASATAITGDELIDLEHSVNSAYRVSPKCRWMFADTTLAAIRKLKDGQGNYLWQMGDVKSGTPGTLLGRPYSVNDSMAALGVAHKVVLFGDFSKYFVRKVGAPVIGVLRERFWPDLGIAGLIRFDGELADTAAVKYLINAAS